MDPRRQQLERWLRRQAGAAAKAALVLKPILGLFQAR
jgi:hypothetical protein